MGFDRGHIKKIAAQLASNGVFIGKSSWKYPDWRGMLYDDLDGEPLLLYVESMQGYQNLNHPLSRHAKLTAKAGDETSGADQQREVFRRQELHGLTEGLIAVSEDGRLAELFPSQFYSLVTSKEFSGKYLGVACPPSFTLHPPDRQKFDIVQSIRTLTLTGHTRNFSSLCFSLNIKRMRCQ